MYSFPLAHVIFPLALTYSDESPQTVDEIISEGYIKDFHQVVTPSPMKYTVFLLFFSYLATGLGYIDFLYHNIDIFGISLLFCILIIFNYCIFAP